MYMYLIKHCSRIYSGPGAACMHAVESHLVESHLVESHFDDPVAFEYKRIWSTPSPLHVRDCELLEQINNSKLVVFIILRPTPQDRHCLK